MERIQLNFTQQRAKRKQLLCRAAAWRYLYLHVPVSGDILRLSWKDVILSAAGVLAAAKDTGGVGGTRPRFWKAQWWAGLKFQQINENENSWQDDTYQESRYSQKDNWRVKRIQHFWQFKVHIIPVIHLFLIYDSTACSKCKLKHIHCLEKLQLV